MVWVSAIRQENAPRLVLSECPVSYVSGESEAWLEDFFAHLMIPSSTDLFRWPARRVDAFAVLLKELREMEMNQHA